MTRKPGKTRKLITCLICGKQAPNAGHMMCKAHYQQLYKQEQRVTAKPVRVRSGLGICQCGQPAVKRVFLHFGQPVTGYPNGDWFNLCERCTELEAQQRRATD